MNGLKITTGMLCASPLLLASAIVCLLSPSLLRADQAAPQSTILSYKHPAKASSTEPPSSAEPAGFGPANALDGDEATRWSSEYSDDQWIYVDLGSTKTVTDVKLDWQQANGKDYDIQVSDDASKWTTVRSITGNSAFGWLDYPNLNAKGRYVRINCLKRATGWGYSLWEFEVFGY